MGKYVIEEFEARSGIFKSQMAKVYQEIADYANKKALRIVKVSFRGDEIVIAMS